MEAHKYIIIGTESLRAFQAKLRAIDRIPEAQAAKAATVMDAQKTSDNVLKAIAILGKLIKESGGQEPVYESSPNGTLVKKQSHLRGSVSTLPPGLTPKESHQAQAIAQAPQVVERSVSSLTTTPALKWCGGRRRG